MGGRGSMTSLEERNRIIFIINEAVDSGARRSKACAVIDLQERTLQRWEKSENGDLRHLTKNVPANKITTEEKNEILDICCSPEYKDLSPGVIVPILAEKGRYIASESTLYRLLRIEKMLAHRSECEPKQKRSKPDELKATGPDQVWSWDITYLISEIKGKYYYLYMFEDIWSRAIRGWEIFEEESAEHAAALMNRICMKNNVREISLHSDNGSPMKGATMLATLQRLGVMPSFSRPHVSDDNPYSESLFKTLKYRPGYPKSFNSLEEAKEWVALFVMWYNCEHRHSGIKFVTPMQRHTGEDKEILRRRNKTYKKAQEKNPERWSRTTRNWDYIQEVTLNPDSLQDRLKKVS